MADLTDRVAQAIGDPGSIAGRRFHPSWGEGRDGYREEPETVTRWAARAVLLVLIETGFITPDMRPIITTTPGTVGPLALSALLTLAMAIGLVLGSVVL